MHYYKGVLVIERKKKKYERIIFTQGEDITMTLNVVHKIRNAKWLNVKEITRDEYIHGVQNS